MSLSFRLTLLTHPKDRALDAMLELSKARRQVGMFTSNYERIARAVGDD